MPTSRRPGRLSRAVLAGLVLVVASACGGSSASSVTESSITVESNPIATSTAAPASSTSDRVPLDERLDNGLQVLVRPDPSTDQVAVMVVYDIGALHDPPGASGLAHFAEHLYVTAGTDDLATRRVEDLVAAYPAGWNAQTTDTATVIATVVDATRLQAELEDAANRMEQLEITPELVEQERLRMLAETDSMFGRGDLAASNLAKETVLPTPHDGRRGGDPDQIAALDVGQLRERVDTLYTPANATLVVAGDVDPESTLATVHGLFANIEPGPTADSPADRAPQPGARATVTMPPVDGTATTSVAVGIAMPDGSDPAYPVALVSVLRLFEAAPGEGFQVGYALLEDPCVLTVTSPIAPGDDDTAADELIAQVQRIVTAPLRLGEGEQVATQLGPLLGFDSMPATASVGPYQVALAAGFGPRVVPDPAATTDALVSLTADDHAAAATSLVDADRVGLVTLRLEAD